MTVKRFYIELGTVRYKNCWELHDRNLGKGSYIAHILDPDIAHKIADLLNADAEK